MRHPGPFAALDGFRFFAACRWPSQSLVLRVGAYHGNGRVGISIYSATGEAVDKLTVNLPDLPLAADEIFVRNAPEGDNAMVLEALRETGLFEVDPGFVPSGFVDAYAQRWRLARADPLIRCRSRGAEYLVQDEATMAKLRQNFEQRQQEIDAEAAVRALRRTV